MRAKIERIDDLSEEEGNIIAYHSIVNIMNVIAGQLQIVLYDLEKGDCRDELEKIVTWIVRIPQRIRMGLLVEKIVGDCSEITSQSLDFLRKYRERLISKLGMDYFEHLVDNLKSIFDISNLRLEETKSRNQTWITPVPI